MWKLSQKILKKNQINEFILRNLSLTPCMQLETNLERSNFSIPIRHVDMSMEIKLARSVLPEIKEEVLDEGLLYHKKFPDIRERCRKLLTHVVDEIPDIFLSTCLMPIHAYRLIEKPEKLTQQNLKTIAIIGWCLKFLDASMLIDDDIIDKSNHRYRKPTWNSLPETGGPNLAMLDAAFVQNATNFLLLNHVLPYPQYKNITREVLRTYTYTQIDQILDVQKYRVEEFEYRKSFVKSYIMTIPLMKIPLYLANIVDEDVHKAAEEFSINITECIQIQDDFEGAFKTQTETQKFNTDIPTGKPTWLAVQAYKLGSPAQKKLLVENYGIDDPNAIEKVVNLYKELKLDVVYENYQIDFYKRMENMISKFPKEIPHQLGYDMMDYAFAGDYKA